MDVNEDGERKVSDLLGSAPDVDVFMNSSLAADDGVTPDVGSVWIDMAPVLTWSENRNVEENSEPLIASTFSRESKSAVLRSSMTVR